jgi:hypothetical protein
LGALSTPNYQFTIIFSALATIESAQTLFAQFGIKGVFIGNSEPLGLLAVNDGGDHLIATLDDFSMKHLFYFSLGLELGLNMANATDFGVVGGVSINARFDVLGEAGLDQCVVSLFVNH